MTFEEVQSKADAGQFIGETLEDALTVAKNNDCLTVGVYESAKVMNM